MRRPSGRELWGEAEAHRDRLGVSKRAYARAVGTSEQTIDGLQHSAFPRRGTIERLRGFIADNPDRMPEPGSPRAIPKGGAAGLRLAQAQTLPAASTVVSDECARAADQATRRRGAVRAQGSVTGKAPVDLSPAERFASAMVETPSDLIATVKRRWPQVWDRVIAQARASGTLPGAVLIAAIERGLEAA